MTLEEFLLARIAEDESSSRWGRLHDDPHDPDGLTKILRWDDGRARTECEAKRRIVEAWPDTFGLWSADQADAARAMKDVALRALAQPYADHPDYRPEWKP